ncbi:MAG: hypothetical protein GF375_03785 [Candidatus Omnitrophica bacterium]|nr:hypothetical protein [Candidatus Omnitrophota bacterium]MBD3269181.1 hypothetical protein [Candidatus Omnitrophota bacterium]
MKKLLVLFLPILFCFTGYCSEQITATLFYSPHCRACMELKEEVLPGLKERYGREVEWVELNTESEPENLEMLIAVNKHFGEGRPLLPSVLIGDKLLVGSGEIKEKAGDVIVKALKERKVSIIPRRVDLIKIFRDFSIFTVAVSGLIDGINPCAFAVIVFFISFLAVYGYGKREIICIGIFYCLAVFITYLLIGMGFFRFLYSLGNFYYAMKIFYYLVAFFCFTLFILAGYDFIRYRRSRMPEETILQLPKSLKKRINLVIGSRMRNRKRGGLPGLCLASLTVGFLVSLLEAVCTGQIYVPVIVFILKNTGFKAEAFFYLFIYNLMFIVPLIVVFSVSLAGVSSAKLSNLLRRHLGILKLLMALLFLALGILIFWVN